MIHQLLALSLSIILLSSCQNTSQKKVTQEKSNFTQADLKPSAPTEDKQTAWLQSIFECKDGKGNCFYIDQEDKICTARFLQFLADANEIYGPSNLSEEDFASAEEKYKSTWSEIYPLYTEENWLFGRGNDDALHIKEVKIDKIKNEVYKVFIDYGEGIKTTNEVTLVTDSKGDFKIDYCSTKFSEF